MRRLEPADLVDLPDLPFVRHQVDPERTRRAWVEGRAVVVDGVGGPPGSEPRGPVWTCLGPAEDLGPLLMEVAAVAPHPWRATVEQPAALPPGWRHLDPHHWHWMLADALVAPAPSPWRVEVLGADQDAAAVDALLDAANPGSFARPGSRDVTLWFGVRRGPGLVAAGALQRMHDGTLHLRGLGVHPSARVAGAGTALSAAMTAHALEHGSGVATLGVYTDNATAVGIYERLGYRVEHTFSSGEVAAP